jgi:RNA polymerase sigma-70 factor (ECF subfamily)
MVQKLLPADVVLDRAAERPSFEDVYSAWFHEVSRWARALGGLSADLDDLTQDVFLVVRRKLDSFDGQNLRGWLYRITQRTVRDYRRRVWFRRLLNNHSTENTLERPTWSVPPPPDPSQIFERREAERLIGRLLDQMSDKRRSTFILFEIEGYSGEEIAELEGISVNTVWTRLHHARRDFFALLARARDEGAVK